MIRIPATSGKRVLPLLSSALAVALLLLFTGGVAQASPTVYVTSQSSDADLSGLTVSVGALSPAFTPASSTYTVAVGTATSSIALTPTAHEAHAAITVNGTPAVSGSPASKALQIGDNVFTVVVTAQDGTTTHTYTLTVNRMSNISTLSSLTVGQGTLSPAFSPNTPIYTVSLPNSATSLEFTPSPADAHATVRIKVGSGSFVWPAPGVFNTGPLAVGTTTIAITVFAQDLSPRTYQVRVSRAASSPTDADLYGLTVDHGTLSPAFDPDTDAYTAAMPYTVESLSLTPTANNGAATLTVNGDPVASGTAAGGTLDVGENVFTVAVIAQDGTTTQTYTVTVTRAAPSTDADLDGLIVSEGALSPTFAAGTHAYQLSVGYAVTQAHFALSYDAGATASFPGGALSGHTATMNLHVGTNVAAFTVLAEDGTTIRTYTVTIVREQATQPPVLDTDGDGIGNHDDPDDDNDGVADVDDIDPLDPTRGKPQPPQPEIPQPQNPQPKQGEVTVTRPKGNTVTVIKNNRTFVPVTCSHPQGCAVTQLPFVLKAGKLKLTGHITVPALKAGQKTTVKLALTTKQAKAFKKAGANGGNLQIKVGATTIKIAVKAKK